MLLDREIQMHTGAKLIVQNEDLPSCANEEDEILEIKGRAQSVMQAVQTCCCLMRVNMARSQAKEASAAMGGSPNQENLGCHRGGMDMLHHMNSLMAFGGMGIMQRHGMASGYGSTMMAPTLMPPRGNMILMNGGSNNSNQAVMKLGLTAAQVGAVIGAGGQNINQIRQVAHMVRESIAKCVVDILCAR